MEGVMMDNPHKKQFRELLKSLSASHPLYTVWYDCMQLWIYAISNSCCYRQDREDRYLSTIKRYTKGETDKISNLFALLVFILDEDREQDFLGEMYMEYGFGDKKKGEYFTPYHVASLMSAITGSDDEAVQDYVVVNDPCCGSGVMLITYINKLIKDGQSPHKKALIVGIDSNLCIAMMCYIQISLLGAAGYVCIRNSLTEPLTGDVLHPPEDAFITPLFFLPIWKIRQMKFGL